MLTKSGFKKSTRTTSAGLAGLAAMAIMSATSFQAQAADDVIRLGNLKLAHFGAISYIKELGPKCGIKVEESTFAKGLDIMQAMIAGELDVGATASEAAISGRAKGVPIYIVAGFATALALVRGSDLIASVPERHTAGLRGGLHRFALPVATPEFTVSMLWHPRLDADPAHRWLRGCVREVCG